MEMIIVPMLSYKLHRFNTRLLNAGYVPSLLTMFRGPMNVLFCHIQRVYLKYSRGMSASDFV